MTALLEVRDLTVTYGRVLALEGVTLAVPTGGSVCLLGPNGAGKTTLMRAISGLLGFHGGRIAEGTVSFDGEEVTGRDASRLVAAGMAQVLEGRRVFANLTVNENLRAGSVARRHGGRWQETRDRVLALFPPLAARLPQAAGLLSGGEQQMLAIGRALMAAPRLLLLDEPSLGLAPLAVGSIGTALAAINAEVALLLVEQSSSLARSLTRSGYLLEAGIVRAAGPTEELLNEDQLRATYLAAGRS